MRTIQPEKKFEDHQHRHCVFTLCNWTQAEKEAIMKWDCKYLVFNHEICPNTGTPHLQGYVEWKGPKTFKTLKNYNPRIHWEWRKGTAEQAIGYCTTYQKALDTRAPGTIPFEKSNEEVSKPEKFEKGTPSQQGKRNDLLEVANEIKDGTPLREIAQRHPTKYIMFNRGMKALKFELQQHRTIKPTVIWIWGEAGVNKTKTARTHHTIGPLENPTKINYCIKDNTKWWGDYDQDLHEAIIIDDFNPYKWETRIDDFKRLLDWAPYTGENKHGHVKINSPFIWITCSSHPKEFWEGNALTEITRRLDYLIHLKREQNTKPKEPKEIETTAAELKLNLERPPARQRTKKEEPPRIPHVLAAEEWIEPEDLPPQENQNYEEEDYPEITEQQNNHKDYDPAEEIFGELSHLKYGPRPPPPSENNLFSDLTKIKRN